MTIRSSSFIGTMTRLLCRTVLYSWHQAKNTHSKRAVLDAAPSDCNSTWSQIPKLGPYGESNCRTNWPGNSTEREAQSRESANGCSLGSLIRFFSQVFSH
jgi:hypothetical protein